MPSWTPSRCPSGVDHLPIPSTRLLGALAAVAGFFFVSAAAALGVSLALFLLAAVDWHRARQPPTVTRSVPSQLPLGEAGVARMEIATGRSARIRATDDLAPEVERLDADEVTGLARPDAAVVWTYRFQPRGRGLHQIGDAHVRVLAPLGLAWRQHRVPLSHEVRVIPGLAEMRRHRLLGLRDRHRRAGSRATRQRGEGRSFESLREYVRGDDPRSIDWKATARRGDLMVRQYEVERSQSLVLVLDAGRMMTEPMGDRQRLDHAMSAALLLADVASVHGDRVGLFAFADEVLTFLPPRRVSTERLTRAMADVHGRPVEPNYPLAFSRLRRGLGHRSLVVVFTDLIDASASHALLAQLTHSASRHLVLAVAIRNPEIQEWAQHLLDDDAGAYRRAAAEEMIETRAIALARMRKAGVHVADVEPTQVVTEVVNRYLEIKYRGRL
jgi:uncharacterized protein (DUF58 family)